VVAGIAPLAWVTKSVPRISGKIYYHSSMEGICSRYRIFG
jgi:hypothetical protein